MKIWLLKRLLPRLIARSCESRIPRSGKRGEAVNCYVVAMDRNYEPYFLATAFDGNKLSGLKWDGRSYSEDLDLSLSELLHGQLSITHYYGLSEVTFSSIYDFAWHYFTRIIYLKIRLYRHIDASFQYFFNKKRLVTKRRMDLLAFMVEDQLVRTHKGIDLLSLMSKIYSMRMFLHPSREVQREKVRLYLESLVQSGELRKVNTEYVVEGKAIETLEKHEETEQRHTEAVKLQRKMFWLTFVAVTFAVVQAGVIKLPTIIDLSNTAP
ncbi:hypothetical protein [Marinobacter sp. F4218]|uniref:hypothetical protein n=1 Tax=Marinobacter sp. F4218 TaxID=2862868 RepID=UPI001C633458|nr:hypothetical protein [Marinobacter sp. F4218]MBW7471700.1 hypothetical protein [Marinobacter sp. F4218]